MSPKLTILWASNSLWNEDTVHEQQGPCHWRSSTVSLRQVQTEPVDTWRSARRVLSIWRVFYQRQHKHVKLNHFLINAIDTFRFPGINRESILGKGIWSTAVEISKKLTMTVTASELVYSFTAVDASGLTWSHSSQRATLLLETPGGANHPSALPAAGGQGHSLGCLPLWLLCLLSDCVTFPSAS